MQNFLNCYNKIYCVFLNVSLFYMCENESATSSKTVNAFLCSRCAVISPSWRRRFRQTKQ